jgi:hypothetical protein
MWSRTFFSSTIYACEIARAIILVPWSEVGMVGLLVWLLTYCAQLGFAVTGPKFSSNFSGFLIPEGN